MVTPLAGCTRTATNNQIFWALGISIAAREMVSLITESLNAYTHTHSRFQGLIESAVYMFPSTLVLYVKAAVVTPLQFSLEQTKQAI